MIAKSNSSIKYSRQCKLSVSASNSSCMALKGKRSFVKLIVYYSSLKEKVNCKY